MIRKDEETLQGGAGSLCQRVLHVVGQVLLQIRRTHVPDPLLNSLILKF